MEYNEKRAFRRRNHFRAKQIGQHPLELVVVHLSNEPSTKAVRSIWCSAYKQMRLTLRGVTTLKGNVSTAIQSSDKCAK